jgi:hypothetical protein
MLAAVRVARRASLLVWHSGGIPDPKVVARTLTPPTFDPAGDVYTVAADGPHRWIAQVTVAGAVRHVRAAPGLLRHPVQQLRLSRDGSRVAAVVGVGASSRLLVGRVRAGRGGAVRFDGFRAVLPGVTDVRGVAWDGPVQLDVTVSSPGGRELVAVDVDGYSVRVLSTDGLRGQPDLVAAAPGQPLVVSAGPALWQELPSGHWHRVAVGTQPNYPG